MDIGTAVLLAAIAAMLAWILAVLFKVPHKLIAMMAAFVVVLLALLFVA